MSGLLKKDFHSRFFQPPMTLQDKVVLPSRGSYTITLQLAAVMCCVTVCGGTPDPSQRETMLHQEDPRQTGGRVQLTGAEQQLDTHFHKLKEQEMAVAQFPPAIHFFKARRHIHRSPIFSLLQIMPKGAALHIHSLSLVSVDWLVKNITYRPHCYICFTWGRSVRFVFSTWDCLYWQLLKTLRANMAYPTDFDYSLMQNLTLSTDDPNNTNPSQDAVWERFEMAFVAIAGLVSYAPVFKDFLYKGLEQLFHDNIMYLELRTELSRVSTVGLNRNIHDKAWSLRTYQEGTHQFVAEHPGFLGAQLIISVPRVLSVSDVKAAVKEAIQMQKDFPEFVAGFDLVRILLRGRTMFFCGFRLASSLPAELGVTLPYFFHAGETDHEGTEVDENILDALLFNTTRIGHGRDNGYALAHHPLAKELSMKDNVAVEVCPISNQVLKLVSNLRNHPAAVLMSEGYPMVVSSDDPSLFGTTERSYDFYEVFVGIGGLRANLGTLKELAINSIRYSSLPSQLKERGLAMWQRMWDKFISENS
ncbi:adenosine deaminase 2-A-like [Salvelinus alpinus]|uniref:adenosine deaminase 2-A-like n=1 Tax=Salvelinus alpinus TaxID=8036 RepID=UPI0039FBE0FE